MGTTLEYEKLKLRVGMEIHQQLDTKKLFCRCPSIIRDDEPDIRIERYQRAVASELGEFDPAALHEFLKKRKLIYEAYSDTNCLVELDEEPPHFPNREALEIALKAALMLNAKIVDEIHVMRKTVIDGSNTSGFQRTMLIALNGFLETSQGKIGIPTICLEEDAARKIAEKEGEVIYRLDRLGIPLIEISTTSEIKSPEQAREVAEKIGTILRLIGKVRRGIGTIRQDVNISIDKGNRVEIKGVQNLRLIPKVIKEEVKRQLKLIEVREKLRERGIREEHLEENFLDVTSVFLETNSNMIREKLKAGCKVFGLKLKGFSSLLKEALGKEIAQYVKASTKAKGILHSDELPAYGISSEEVKEVKKKLNVAEEDAFILVVESEKEAKKALKIALDRCKMAIAGVPKETRKAREDGSSEYMRPLPGAARMYPETDIPSILVEEKLIERLRKELPKSLDEKLREYMNLGLSKEQANQILKSRKMHLFDSLVKKNYKPSLIATLLLSLEKEVKRKFGLEIELKIQDYEEILQRLSKGEISQHVIPEIIFKAIKEEKSLKILLDEFSAKVPRDKIEEEVEKLIAEIKPKSKKDLKRVIAKIVAKFEGRVSGKLVSDIVREKMKSG